MRVGPVPKPDADPEPLAGINEVRPDVAGLISCRLCPDNAQIVPSLLFEKFLQTRLGTLGISALQGARIDPEHPGLPAGPLNFVEGCSARPVVEEMFRSEEDNCQDEHDNQVVPQ